VSPDGRTIATAAGRGTARLWRPEQGAAPRLRGHQGSSTTSSVSPDVRALVTVPDDGTARIWDVATDGSREVATLAVRRRRRGRDPLQPRGTELLSVRGARWRRVDAVESEAVVIRGSYHIGGDATTPRSSRRAQLVSAARAFGWDRCLRRGEDLDAPAPRVDKSVAVSNGREESSQRDGSTDLREAGSSPSGYRRAPDDCSGSSGEQSGDPWTRIRSDISSEQTLEAPVERAYGSGVASAGCGPTMQNTGRASRASSSATTASASRRPAGRRVELGASPPAGWSCR